jgi:hypothetical protein
MEACRLRCKGRVMRGTGGIKHRCAVGYSQLPVRKLTDDENL